MDTTSVKDELILQNNAVIKYINIITVTENQ